MRDDPSAIAPERVLVFEVYGDVREFQKFCEKLGFDWFFDVEEELNLVGGFEVKGKRKKDFAAGHLYMAMPSRESLEGLLSLWRQYQSGDDIPHSSAPWWQIFDHLKDLRPWGPQDRVRPEDEERWADLLEGDPDERIRVEAEIWFHRDPLKRKAATDAVAAHLRELEASIVDRAEITEVAYRAVLFDVPRCHLRGLLDMPQDVALLRIDDIQFVRPQSIAGIAVRGEPETVSAERPPQDGRTIRAALFDGYPVQNHPLLKDRLEVADPDDLAPLCPVGQRSHGTAMASLILHGDLHENGETLPHRLYVRPVLVGDPARPDAHERFPPDRLPIPTIVRAVRRMKEGEGGDPPDAPSVVIVNHSLGDAARPFARFVTPWARVLDWLAYEYRLLFIVSAGNCPDDLPMPAYGSVAECVGAAPTGREREVVKALDGQKAVRRLLSPAESLNALTVGALHRDGQTPPPDVGWRIDPFPGLRTAAVYSRLGLGLRGAVKPEVVEAGGRGSVSVRDRGGTVALELLDRFRGFGQRAAAPPPGTGDVAHQADSIGTSNAAALVTRAAVRIVDSLESLRDEPGGDQVVREDRLAVVTKALLVHGASWRGSGDSLEEIVEPQDRRLWQERRNNIARQIGYGQVDIDRVLEGTEHRVSLVGCGEIGAEEARLFSLPVPPELFGKRIRRRVTVTLAWLTPVNPNHQQYRRAILELAPPQWGKTNWPAAKGTGLVQPPDGAAGKGTVIHRVFEDEKAAVREKEGRMAVVVQCRTPMTLERPVPFAMALTLEVDPAIGAGIDIHTHVRNALKVGVPA